MQGQYGSEGPLPIHEQFSIRGLPLQQLHIGLIEARRETRPQGARLRFLQQLHIGLIEESLAPSEAVCHPPFPGLLL